MDDMGPEDERGHAPVQRRGGEVTDDALAWLNRLDAEEPFFAFIHYYDPHARYEAPTDFATTGDPYDDEIAYVDSQVKRLISSLESSRRDDNTIVIVIADHGESLGEHGEPTHGALIYQGTQHVPWVMSMPDGRWAGTEVTERVGQVDFLPTLLDLYDLEALQDLRLDVDHLRARRNLPEVHPGRGVRRRRERLLLPLQILLSLSD